MDADYQIKLTLEEKIVCLKEISSRLKKILYVYEKSQDPNSGYSYKAFCGGIAMYISSSNILFNGELVALLVNINSILNEDLNSAQLKRLVFESMNTTRQFLSKYIALQEAQDNQSSGDLQENISGSC